LLSAEQKCLNLAWNACQLDRQEVPPKLDNSTVTKAPFILKINPISKPAVSFWKCKYGVHCRSVYLPGKMWCLFLGCVCSYMSNHQILGKQQSIRDKPVNNIWCTATKLATVSAATYLPQLGCREKD